MTIEYLDEHHQGPFIRNEKAQNDPSLGRRGQNLATMSDVYRAADVSVEGEGMSATVGEMAPEFSLPGTTGPGLDLAELHGKGRAALFFYPADRTAG